MEGICCGSSVGAVQGGGEGSDGVSSSFDVPADSSPGRARRGITGANGKRMIVDVNFKMVQSDVKSAARSRIWSEVAMLYRENGQTAIDRAAQSTRHFSDNQLVVQTMRMADIRIMWW